MRRKAWTVIPAVLRKGEKKSEERSADNSPAHTPKRGDGRPKVRRLPTSPRSSLEGLQLRQEHAPSRAKMKRLGLFETGCALPKNYVKFHVIFRMRDHVRTIGLTSRFWLIAAPLHAPKEHHHPIQRYPDSNPLRGFRPVFSLPACVCICAEVRRCAFGVYAESPRSHRLSRSNGNNLLKSNPFGHAKAPG